MVRDLSGRINISVYLIGDYSNVNVPVFSSHDDMDFPNLIAYLWLLNPACHSGAGRQGLVFTYNFHLATLSMCSFTKILLASGIFFFNCCVMTVSFRGEAILVSQRRSESKFVPGVTMALLECPPPWNSIVPKASVGLSCVCLLMDHFSDRLSFLAKRSVLSFWADEMPGGRPTCWPIRRPQQHLGERPQSYYTHRFKQHDPSDRCDGRVTAGSDCVIHTCSCKGWDCYCVCHLIVYPLFISPTRFQHGYINVFSPNVDIIQMCWIFHLVLN